jgi:hypothetical protein
MDEYSVVCLEKVLSKVVKNSADSEGLKKIILLKSTENCQSNLFIYGNTYIGAFLLLNCLNFRLV